MFIDWADLPGWAKRHRVGQGEYPHGPSPARPTVPPDPRAGGLWRDLPGDSPCGILRVFVQLDRNQGIG